MLLDIIREEERFQHHEDDEELHQDDEPERPSYGHVAEPLIVEVPYSEYSLHECKGMKFI